MLGSKSMIVLKTDDINYLSILQKGSPLHSTAVRGSSMFLILPACGVAKNPTLCMSPIGYGRPFYAFISVITEVDSSYQLCFRCVCVSVDLHRPCLLLPHFRGRGVGPSPTPHTGPPRAARLTPRAGAPVCTLPRIVSDPLQV